MLGSFDSYSKNYNELVDKALRQTGYDTNSLVVAKLLKLKSLFPSLSNKPLHLLDFGCGIGNLYGHLADFFPQATYTGVDLSKESILKARSRFPGDTNFQYYDAPDWETPKYDLIFASGVFHHIPHTDHAVLIEKLSSLLNQSGRLVIWEHNPINPLTQKIVKECIFDQDAILVPSRDIKNHFRRASLSKIQIIYTTFFPKFLSVLNFMDPYLGWLPLGGQYVITGERVG
jgi:trans-aconitate methyltransferase